MGILGLIFFYIGISMGWLYVSIYNLPLLTLQRAYSISQEFMGVVLGSAVVPIAMCITWKKANKWGSIGGAVVGFCVGIVAWLVTTSALNGGDLTVTVRHHHHNASIAMLIKRLDYRRRSRDARWQPRLDWCWRDRDCRHLAHRKSSPL